MKEPVSPDVIVAQNLSRSIVEAVLLRCSPGALVSELSPEALAALRYCWAAWRRPSKRLPPLPDDGELKEPGWGRWTGQEEPPGKWLYWILCAGRGWGKTAVGTQFVIDRARRFPGCRIALVAQTTTSLWRDCVLGRSGIIEKSPSWFSPHQHKTGKMLIYPNGSTVYLFTAEEPRGLRGPNNDFALVEELAAQPYAQAVWDQLQMTMRSGMHPQTCVATTPRNMQPLVNLIQSRSSAVTIGSSMENASNLAPSWLEEHVVPLLGTDFGTEEVEGRIVFESSGALFKRAWFNREKWCPDSFKESKYKRIGIGIDPARSSGHAADSWGIVKAALREDGLIAVLADATVNDTPDVAVQAAVDLYHADPSASFMVADVGAGGQMVDGLIRMATGGRGVRVLRKSGNKGKRAWAEGAALAFGRKMAFCAPGLSDLVTECCTWTDDTKADGSPKKKSPNRMDALAQVVCELIGRSPAPTHESAPHVPRRGGGIW